MKISNSFNAAGPHYGHMVQETIMLKYLLEAGNDDIVSIEYFDDIGIERSDGKIVAVQSKSALSWNPVSDQSEDFWKTISNWIYMSEEGKIDPSKTKFVIALSKKRNGSLSTQFMLAKTTKDYNTLLIMIKDRFKDKTPNTISKYLIHFLSANQEVVKQIVINFNIEIYNDPKEEILRKLRMQEEERNVLNIFDMMTGWLKNKIESLIRDKKSAFVKGDEFRRQLFASRRILDKRFMLKSYATEPSIEETGEHLTRMYVKQLELIDCNTEVKIEAISAYIKARIDRIRWADDGDVHSLSFDEFYKSIRQKWKNVRRRIDVLHKTESPEKKGKLVLFECNDFREKLEGRDVPFHFTPGCFHDCADKLEIGWHDDYLRRLRGDSQ